LLHEATEIRHLQEISKGSGFDLLGKKYMKMNNSQKRLWDEQFDLFYPQAHNQAVEAEYRFIAKQVRLKKGIDLGKDGHLLAMIAEPDRSVRWDVLKHFKIDGTPIQNLPNFNAMEEIADSRLSDLIRSVKEMRK
jgi:hypothetical protein